MYVVVGIGRLLYAFTAGIEILAGKVSHGVQEEAILNIHLFIEADISHSKDQFHSQLLRHRYSVC